MVPMVHVIVFTGILVHIGQNSLEYRPFKVQECGPCTETGREHIPVAELPAQDTRAGAPQVLGCSGIPGRVES